MSSGPEINRRKRLVIAQNHNALKNPKKRSALLERAAANGNDTVIFPFNSPKNIFREIQARGLIPETGGRNMSLLVPRKYFFLHRDLFRMEGGRRKMKTHFCTTSPDTIAIIRTQAEKIFRSAAGIKTFHLWPDRDEIWCSCPTCRAFSGTDQYRMALNTAADVLQQVNPDAVISYYDNDTGDNDDSRGSDDSEIKLRPNVFKIKPDEIVLYD